MNDQEVARLLLPVPIRDLDKLTKYLTQAYGKDLRFDTKDQWLVFWKEQR